MTLASHGGSDNRSPASENRGFSRPLGGPFRSPGFSPNNFGVELPEEIKSAMTEIEVSAGLLKKGNHLMDLTLPDNTLVVMVKRDMKFFIPRGKTILKTGDKLLVITDNDEELLHT